MKPLLSTGEVAALLGFSPRHVLPEVHRGRLRAVSFQTGSRPTLRYRVDDVHAWLARYSQVLNAAAGDPDRSRPAMVGAARSAEDRIPSGR